jgi:hypothetical protein
MNQAAIWQINTEYTIPKAATAASKPSFSSCAVMAGSPAANWFPAVVERAAAKIDKHFHSSEHNKLLLTQELLAYTIIAVHCSLHNRVEKLMNKIRAQASTHILVNSWSKYKT